MKTTSRFYFLAMTLAASVMMLIFAACGGDDDDPTTPTPREEPSTPTDPDNPSQGTLQLMMTCSTCQGSTNCTTCNGTGKGCKTCKGKGIHCKSCGTSGECYDCNGSGTCRSCYGRQGTQCTWCLSKPGYCGKCVGTGRYGTAKCTSCNGTGICHYCGGKYWTSCSSCHGSGNCNRCYGRGSCPTCYGNPPDCTTCGGDGHCAACTNADGKCVACTGTGEVGLSALTFFDAGGDEKVFIHGTAQWSVSADVEWLRFSRSSGSGDNTITVTAAANNTATARTGVITFAYGNAKTTINVSQGGAPVQLSVEPSSIFVNANGTGESVTISSNTSWTVKAADSWVTCSPTSGNGNATLTISAPAYSGTRYSMLTITETTGEVSIEVPVAQAESRDKLTLLKSLLEKPLGVVDVDMKNAAYGTILAEVKKLYKVSENSSSFIVYDFYNPSLKEITYQGMAISLFSYYSSRYSKSAGYVFSIDESKSSEEYKNCRNNILQDFKYNLNITMTKDNSSSELEEYSGTDTDNIKYVVYIRNPRRIDIYAYYK